MKLMKIIFSCLIIFSLLMNHLQMKHTILRRRKLNSKFRKIFKMSDVPFVQDCTNEQWLDKFELKNLIAGTNELITKQIEKAKAEGKTSEDKLIDTELDEMRITRLRILQHNKFYLLKGEMASEEDSPLGIAICVKSCPKALKDVCLLDDQKAKFNTRAYFYYIEKCVSSRKMRVSYIGQDTNCRDAVGTAVPWHIAMFQTIQVDLPNVDFGISDLARAAKAELNNIISTAITTAKEEAKKITDDVDGVINAVKEEAKKYQPEQLKKTAREEVKKVVDGIETTINNAKDDVKSIIKEAETTVKTTEEEAKKVADVGRATKMVKRIISETIEGILAAVVDKILEGLKWATGHLVLNVMHFTPLVVISGPVQLAVGVVQIGLKVKEIIEFAKKSYEEVAAFLKDHPFQLFLQKSKVKADKAPGEQLSKRSFKSFIETLNCAIAKETEHDTPALRNLMKGLYNVIAIDKKDPQTVLPDDVQKVYNSYYGGCKRRRKLSQ